MTDSFAAMTTCHRAPMAESFDGEVHEGFDRSNLTRGWFPSDERNLPRFGNSDHREKSASPVSEFPRMGPLVDAYLKVKMV